MDSAIRGIRDWQKQHSEEVAKLERVHQDLLEEVRDLFYIQHAYAMSC